MKTQQSPQPVGEQPGAAIDHLAVKLDRGATSLRTRASDGREAEAADSGGLERLLEALHHGRLTPLEVRILTRVSDRETTVVDIAESMRIPSSVIRRASRGLVARGLLRRRRRRGHPLTLTLTATEPGTSALSRVARSLPTTAMQVKAAGSPRRVVVGYDGSDAAKRALARSAVASRLGGTVTVVAVRPRPPSTGLTSEPFAEVAEEPSDLLAEARSVLTAAGTSEVETVAREGNPAIEIVDIARSVDADLVVVGRNSGRFMSRAIFGSVAVRVVELSQRDVLVVA